jgi:IrrE N-terminal-like domain
VRKLDWWKTVSDEAEQLTRDCRPISFPVDLAKLAARRGILRVRFCPMPVDGALKVVANGFEVQMRSNRERSVPISELDPSALGLRERFSLSHEISHCFFYDAERRRVRPHPSKPFLEALCNHGAACLLMPEALVKREIGGRIHPLRSLETALNLAEIAQVSVTVAVRRLDRLPDLKISDYALILLDRNAEGAWVTSAAFQSGSLLGWKQPALHQGPPQWLKKLAPGAFDAAGKVHRVPRDHKWDYVSRVVPNPKRPAQLLVEIRLEQSAQG